MTGFPADRGRRSLDARPTTSRVVASFPTFPTDAPKLPSSPRDPHTRRACASAAKARSLRRLGNGDEPRVSAKTRGASKLERRVLGRPNLRRSTSDFKDAAAAFKARAPAFVRLRRAADEHRAMNGVLEALALATGGRDAAPFSKMKNPRRRREERRLKNAPRLSPRTKTPRTDRARVFAVPGCVLDVPLCPTRDRYTARSFGAARFRRARVTARGALVDALGGGRVARQPFFEKKASGDGAAPACVCPRRRGHVASCQPQTAADRRVVRAVAVARRRSSAGGLICVFSPFFSPRRFFRKFSPSRRARSATSPEVRQLERDEFSFQKLELPSEARMFGAAGARPSRRCCERVYLVRTVSYFYFSRRCFLFLGSRFRAGCEPPRPRRSERERVSAHAPGSPPPPDGKPGQPAFQIRRVSGDPR